MKYAECEYVLVVICQVMSSKKKKKKIVLCLKIISKKKKKKVKKKFQTFFPKNNDDVIKNFDFFFQKFKKLWQFDILTKFEDNWTSRTAVSIGVAILPPPPPPRLRGRNSPLRIGLTGYMKYLYLTSSPPRIVV